MAIHLFDLLVGIHHKSRRIRTIGMSHDLESALVEFQHQLFILGRFVGQRRNQTGSSIHKEFHQIGRDPIVMIEGARFLEVSQELRRQMMVYGHGSKRSPSANRKLAAIAQGGIQLNLLQIPSRIHHTRNAVPVQVMGGIPQQRQLLVLRELIRQGPLHNGHGCFQQNPTGMAAGVADNIFFFCRIGHRLIRDACQSQGLAVQPERMLGRVMHHHRAIGNGSIKQFTCGSRRWYGAEVRSTK